jgi:hypothetical protein
MALELRRGRKVTHIEHIVQQAIADMQITDDTVSRLLVLFLFCVGAGISGVLFLALDRILFDIGSKSILRITYDRPIASLAWRWFMGPFLTAMFGIALQIWKPSVFSLAVIGFSWQTFPNKVRQTIETLSEDVQPAATESEGDDE